MVSLHERQGLVRWALMETQARLLDISTKFGYGHYSCTNGYQSHQILRPPGLFVLREVLYWALGRYAQYHFACSAPRLSSHRWCFVCLVLCSAMPRERGKPRRGPTYYSRFGRHKCPGPASLALIPGGSDHPGSSGQNWFEQAQPEPRPSSTEGLHGGCPVEEEIPPNWEEIFPFLPSTALEHRLATCTTIPFQEPVETGCIVEEEVSPPEDHSGQNSAATMDEDPVTDSAAANDSVAATMDEDPDDEQAHDDEADEQTHPTPSSCRLTEDHLVLIFEMRKDLAEQQHRQSIFNKRLDALYDSLSSEPEKSRCPTCCQPFIFRLRQDGCPGSPHV
jgi:hypothetical protein